MWRVCGSLSARCSASWMNEWARREELNTFQGWILEEICYVRNIHELNSHQSWDLICCAWTQAGLDERCYENFRILLFSNDALTYFSSLLVPFVRRRTFCKPIELSFSFLFLLECVRYRVKILWPPRRLCKGVNSEFFQAMSSVFHVYECESLHECELHSNSLNFYSRFYSRSFRAHDNVLVILGNKQKKLVTCFRNYLHISTDLSSSCYRFEPKSSLTR